MKPYTGYNPQAIQDKGIRNAVMAIHDFCLQLNSVVGQSQIYTATSPTTTQSTAKTAGIKGPGSGAEGGLSLVNWVPYAPNSEAIGVTTDAGSHGWLALDLSALPDHTNTVVLSAPASSGTLQLLDIDQTITGRCTYQCHTDNTFLIKQFSGGASQVFAVTDSTGANDFLAVNGDGSVTAIGNVTSGGVVSGEAVGCASGSFYADANGVWDSVLLYSPSTGNTAILSLTAIGASQTYAFPATGGTIATTNGTQTLASTTLNPGCIIKFGNSGVTMQDQSTTTKQMKFNMTGISASTTRTMKWQDTNGSVVVVGNTTAASGTLGVVSLTGQTGSVASTNLLTGNTTSAGMYRVNVYAVVSTADAGTSSLTVTVGWNDGVQAQTDTSITIPTNLSSGKTGKGTVVLYSAASQNVTISTTLAKTNSPAYAIYARIVALG